MYLSNYMEEIIEKTMKGVTYTAPPKVYLALFISATDDAAGGTEISYTGYIRREITFTTPAPESGGIGVKNDSEIKFAESSTDSGTVTHIGIYDSLVGGNRLLHGKLNEDKQIKSGVSPTVRTGEIVYWSTGNMSVAFKTRWLNTLRGNSIDGFTAHVTLFNGNPEKGGVELTGGSFERRPIEFSSPVESNTGSMSMENTAAIEMPIATTSLGTYDYDVICDAKTGGVPIWYKQASAETYGKGDAVIYDPGSIKIGVN